MNICDGTTVLVTTQYTCAKICNGDVDFEATYDFNGVTLFASIIEDATYKWILTDVNNNVILEIGSHSYYQVINNLSRPFYQTTINIGNLGVGGILNVGSSFQVLSNLLTTNDIFIINNTFSIHLEVNRRGRIKKSNKTIISI